MKTAVMAVGALALAGASFGAGRISATASASATATSAPAVMAPAPVPSVSCTSTSTSNNALADMIKDRKVKHEAAVRKANQAAGAPTRVSDIDPSPVH